MIAGAFDDTGGPDTRHEDYANRLDSMIQNDQLVRPISMDDEFHAEDGITPDWGDDDIELILEELTELRPDHGLIRDDFQK